MRDYNGMRGAVPGPWRAHDWQTCRVMREIADEWSERLRIANRHAGLPDVA